MNRAVAPNTSLFFALNLPEHLAPDLKWIEDNIRVVLVEMTTRDADQAFAPLRVSVDIPRGMERVVYDPTAGGDQGGFRLRAESGKGEYRFWIRHPEQDGPF